MKLYKKSVIILKGHYSAARTFNRAEPRQRKKTPEQTNIRRSEKNSSGRAAATRSISFPYLRASSPLSHPFPKGSDRGEKGVRSG